MNEIQAIAEKYFSLEEKQKVEVIIGKGKLIIHIVLSAYNGFSTNTLELFRRDTSHLINFVTTFNAIQINVVNKKTLTIVYETLDF